MFYAEGTLQGVRKGVERLFIKEAMRGRNIVSSTEQRQADVSGTLGDQGLLGATAFSSILPLSNHD